MPKIFKYSSKTYFDLCKDCLTKMTPEDCMIATKDTDSLSSYKKDGNTFYCDHCGLELKKENY